MEDEGNQKKMQIKQVVLWRLKGISKTGKLCR